MGGRTPNHRWPAVFFSSSHARKSREPNGKHPEPSVGHVPGSAVVAALKRADDLHARDGVRAAQLRHRVLFLASIGASRHVEHKA